MSDLVDDRIVSMKFDNQAFESKLGETIASLDKLRRSLDFSNSRKSFDDLNSSASRFNLNGMASAADNVAHHLSLMGVVGIAAIGGLAYKVGSFVTGIARNDILGPIITGGTKRAENIQQAQFMFRGLGINVKEAMQNALDAVKGTAFGLDEAAKAAAQFGASGIKTGTQMTSALRGVAGAAALTGKSFTEIADIFAGSAGSGKVNSMDLQQFSTRGLNAAAAIAPILGKTEKQVRAMASAGKLDFATFAAAMDKAFGAHAKEANQLFSGSLANVHAAMSRLGASFIGPQLFHLRDIFNALSPVIDTVNASLQPVLLTFNHFLHLGTNQITGFLKGINFSNFNKGIGNFVVGLQHGFNYVKQFAEIIKSAFRDIFPASATSKFVAFSEGFRKFAEHLKLGSETATKVKSIFRGFFAVFDIGWTIFKELLGLVGDLFHALIPAGNSLVSFGSKGGDMLTRLDAALVKGGGIHKFFLNLGGYVSNAVKFVEDLKNKIIDFFHINIGPNRVSSRLQSLSDGALSVGSVWQRLTGIFTGVIHVLDKAWGYISTWFKQLGHKIAGAFKPGDFKVALDALNIGLIGGIVVLLKKFMSGGFLNILGGSNLTSKISGLFGGLNKTLGAMQANLKSGTLLKIAEAMGILTISIIALSLINSGNLTKALTAIAIGFGQLAAVMTLLDKLNFKTSSAKLVAIATSMILLAVAIDILAIAIFALSRLSWTELAKGLAGVGGGLLLLVATAKLISGNSVGLIAAGVGMIAISAGLVVFAGAMKLFAAMSWTDIAKGLVAVAGGLGLIALAMKAMPASSIISGAGFIEIAFGLSLLAGAVKLFSLLSWGDIGKGLLGIAGSLVIVALAMNLMPITLPITAAGMVILSSALVILAGAVKLMGATNLGTLAKGIGAFALMLGILVVAMTLMDGALPGALALVIVAHSLDILAKVLKTLGDLKISELLTGLAAIAAVLLVLGVAAALMAPVIPELLALGVALSLIGVSFALFGVGAIAVGKAFEIMSKSGAAGAKGMVAAIKILLTALPDIVTAIAHSLIDLAKQLLEAVPLFVRIISAILDQMAQTIIEQAPHIAKGVVVLITEMIKVIRETFPGLIAIGFEMLKTFLKGISDNIGEVVKLGVDIITNFVNSLIANMPQLAAEAAALIISFLDEFGKQAGNVVQAGADFLVRFLRGISENISTVVLAAAQVVVSFINGMASAVVSIVNAGGDFLVRFLRGIDQNLEKVLSTVTKIIVKFVSGMSSNVISIVNAGGDFLVRFLRGIESNIEKVTGTAVKVILKFLRAMALNGLAIANGAADVLIMFLNGLRNAIDVKGPEINSAALHLIGAIINGLTLGAASQARHLWDIGWNIGKSILGGAAKAVGASSPAKEFIKLAHFMVDGLVVGLQNNNAAEVASAKLGSNVISAMQKTLSDIPTHLSGLQEFKPTITPVLDLSGVRQEAGKLDGLINKSSITPSVSFGHAQSIATSDALSKALSATQQAERVQQITFEQTINAPKPLSTNDIYRNTKSQLILAKEKLGIS